jgi:hypothetical protein
MERLGKIYRNREGKRLKTIDYRTEDEGNKKLKIKMQKLQCKNKKVKRN